MLAIALQLLGIFYEDKQNLLYVLNEAGERTHVRHTLDWQARRAHILENMQEVMSEVADPPQLPFEVEYLESKEFATYTRHRITFVVEEGDRLPAYLLIPKSITKPVPGVAASPYIRAVPLSYTTRRFLPTTAWPNAQPTLLVARRPHASATRAATRSVKNSTNSGARITPVFGMSCAYHRSCITGAV